MSTKFYTYIALCSDKSYYTGVTHSKEKREKKHNDGEGCRYTRDRRPVKIVYTEEFDTLKEAIQREQQIKGWTRKKKENLIKFGHPNPNKKITYAHFPKTKTTKTIDSPI